MSTPFWLAVNCRRSEKGNSPEHWTAHWDEDSCGKRVKKPISDEEGGQLIFRGQDYASLNAKEIYRDFVLKVLGQISRLALGPDARLYSGEMAEVPIAYDCLLCKGTAPEVIKSLIDRYNAGHGGYPRA